MKPMTIQRAREILGEYGTKLTNEQIQEVMDCFELVIEVGFQQFEDKYKSKKEANNHE